MEPKICLCGIELETIAAEINIFKYKNPDSAIDFQEILMQLDQNYQSELTNEILTAEKIERFYKHYYNCSWDDIFIVSRIRDIKYQNNQIISLIDWKGFPTSNPNNEQSWLPIAEAGLEVVKEYLQLPDQQQMFIELLQKLGPEAQDELCAELSKYCSAIINCSMSECLSKDNSLQQILVNALELEIDVHNSYENDLDQVIKAIQSDKVLNVEKLPERVGYYFDIIADGYMQKLFVSRKSVRCCPVMFSFLKTYSSPQ